MTCEAVREHLAEHVLGTLPDELDARLGAHLRGCMSCRLERAALEEGVSTLASAAHQVEPPEGLKDRVLGVLEEERTETPAATRRARPSLRRVAVAAAAVIVLVASAGVAAWQSARAAHYHGVAAHYESFLEAL